jgi:dinuclear metal center YbgI/SA1388 family protein
MVSLDATEAAIQSALASACQLLVTHHPLIFNAPKSISTATPQGACIHAAIRGGLSIVSMHTNYDCAEGGLNDLLARRIGLSVCSPLQVTSVRELVKLVVYVPRDHLERLRLALLPHAEVLGAYGCCSFAAPGEGTFTPLEGARPFIGTVGSPERVPEQRLELLLDRTVLPRAIKSLLAAHPYEEPAYDIYPLLNEGAASGLGRIGRLPEPLSLADFARRLRQELAAPGLRFVGDPETRVSKVALCGGSGASLMRAAVRGGADVLVTGDIKYHDARDAEGLGLALVDAGHFPTEIIMVEGVTGRLGRMLAEAGYAGCDVVPCCVENDPFRCLDQTA